MSETRELNAEILAEARSGSPAAGEAGLAPRARAPGELGPAWLGPDAEMVFGFVCRPGEPLDPSRGGPPVALAAASIAMLILCGSLALVLCATYAGYREVEWQDTDQTSAILASEPALVSGQLVAAIASIATFSLWYRALTDRARAVAILRPIYSARYALVMLLIPVANLFGPIQTFSLLWDALSPRKERDRDRRTGFIMAGWWCLVLGAFVLGRIGFVHSSRIRYYNYDWHTRPSCNRSWPTSARKVHARTRRRRSAPARVARESAQARSILPSAWRANRPSSRGWTGSSDGHGQPPNRVRW